MQEFYCKTRVIFGNDAWQWLSGRKWERLLLVADPYFVESGWAQRIADMVQTEKKEIWDKVKPDPTVELAAEGTALMREFKPDLLIALGGGSAMDTAKAMVYFAGDGVTFVAVPTTSGSGSEVTDFAILTHGDVKQPLVDRRLQPDVALLIPELVEKLPPALVADGGFDVLSHAAESFVAKNANPITQAMAASSFSAVLPAFPPPIGAIPGCGRRSTWLPPWRAWLFLSQVWGCAMPCPTLWAGCSTFPMAG